MVVKQMRKIVVSILTERRLLFMQKQYVEYQRINCGMNLTVDIDKSSLEYWTSMRNRFAIHSALCSLYFLFRSKPAKADVALAFQSFFNKLETAAETNGFADDSQVTRCEQSNVPKQVTLATVKRKRQAKRTLDERPVGKEADPRVAAAIRDIVVASLRAKARKRRLASELDEWVRKNPRKAKTRLSKDEAANAAKRPTARSKRLSKRVAEQV